VVKVGEIRKEEVLQEMIGRKFNRKTSLYAKGRFRELK